MAIWIDALKTKRETMKQFTNIDDAKVCLCISNVDWADLNSLDEIYNQVTYISLKDTETSYSGLEKFERLEEFSTETEFKHNFCKMGSLKRLHLAWHKHYAKSLGLSFENLEELFVRYFSEKDLKILGNFKKLKSLELVQGGLNSLEHLSQCEKLESLSLAYIRSLTQLEELIRCKNITRIELEQLPKIKEINISSCEKLKELRITDLKNLETIHGVTNENLKIFKLYNSDHINNVYFLSECHNLSSLHVVGCKQILNLKGIKNFEKLIDFNSDIEVDAHDLNWLKNNKRLELLSLDKKNALTDFKWLTNKHKLKRIFVCFAGDEIDWHQLFALNQINFIHIQCIKKLNVEKTFEDIDAIAGVFGKKVYQQVEFNTRYPFYRLDVHTTTKHAK